MSATDELFVILAKIGATPTLYGKPITSDELKLRVLENVIDRAMRTNHDPGDEDERER